MTSEDKTERKKITLESRTQRQEEREQGRKSKQDARLRIVNKKNREKKIYVRKSAWNSAKVLMSSMTA